MTRYGIGHKLTVKILYGKPAISDHGLVCVEDPKHPWYATC